MLSGIGPAEHLRENGIAVVADRPGVGRNLQDHMELYIQQESTQPITLVGAEPILEGIDRRAMAVLQPALRDQPLRSGRLRALARRRRLPDIQYHFIPAAVRYDGKAAAKSHSFQAHVGPMRSKSAVRSCCARPTPIEAGDRSFMSHPDDWTEFRHCIRLTREIRRGMATLIAARKSHRARTSSRTTISTSSSAITPKAPPLRHLQDGPYG